MPVFACKWENKNVTLVSATDKQRAIVALDEFAAVEDADLVQVKVPVLVTLRLDAGGAWELQSDGMGGQLDQLLRDIVALQDCK